MDPKRVVIIFGKEGGVKAQVFGAKGEECQEMTKWLNDLYGVKKVKFKSEYYEETEKTKLVDGLPSGHCG